MAPNVNDPHVHSLKKIISQTDFKTFVFEDKMTKYLSI